MRQAPQPQRLDVGGFAEACKRLGLDQTLTVRVVFDDPRGEPRDILVQVTRFHVTHQLGLIGVGTDLKLRERFVSPDWLNDRVSAVRRIEAILAELNSKKGQRPNGD
jgi:hypothetical protein